MQQSHQQEQRQWQIAKLSYHEEWKYIHCPPNSKVQKVTMANRNDQVNNFHNK